jgi:hypothetical protein
MRRTLPAVSLIVVLLSSAVAAAQAKPRESFPDVAQLKAMAARFAPTPMRVDTSRLSPGDAQALVKLIEAARVVDVLYMQQLWSGDLALYEKLKRDRTPLGQARLRYFWINKGPWSDLDEHRAFLPGVPGRKPLGANFYPADMTKQEFEDWVKGLAKEQQEAAESYFTVITRDEQGKLRIVPYDQAYKEDLQRAAALLREAAGLTDNETLKRFLSARADAFLSNDYYPSDVAWMDLDAPLDITIGPYETYTDELFGYKAAFEAYVNLRDDAESSKMAAFARHLQEIEDHLPEDPQYRNPKLGAAAPIRVVNEILAAGDGEHAVQTTAYNLPNDERVIREKGSKRVMMKNVQEAKFRSVLIPIAQRLLAAKDSPDVSFEPFFTHTLAHELMHGLGPHDIKVAGRETTVRQELKELYGAIEEAKADATGLFALQYMMDHAKEMKLEGVLRSGEAAERQLYTTYLASAFRSLRFGIVEAHGRGMALQFNYLVDHGGFVQNPDGSFAVDFAKIKPAVRELTHDLLTLEATGDYAGAKRMLDALAVIRPSVQQQLDKLAGVPVDIEPQFVTADELTAVTPKPAAKPGVKPRRKRR